MTAPNDADRLVHAFFQEGPAELAPPVIARIRGEVHETKQRTFRRPWRTPSMPRTFLLVASLTAIMVAVGAMLIAGTGGRAPVTSPAPSALVIAPPTATPSPTATPGPSPHPLAAGEAWIVLGGDSWASLIRPDGSGQHDILTGLGVSVSDPAWSPDGQKLAFAGNGDRGSQLWVANADGTGARQVTPTPAGCPEGLCDEAVNPAWSPDGRTIAYIDPQHQGGIATRYALMLLDVETGTTTEVYSTSTAGLARPTWSPDSQSIALEIDHYQGALEDSSTSGTTIAVVDLTAADKTPKEITDPALLAGYPSWHPTEDRIVFRTNRFDTNTKTLLDERIPSDLYVIASDGSGLTNLTKNAVNGPVMRAPSWTPDGRILYSVLDATTLDEVLRIVDADGSNGRSATGTTVTNGEGRWRPGT